MPLEELELLISCFMENGDTVSELSYSNNLTSGNYQIIIVDSNNCQVQDSFTINNPNPIQLFVSVEDVLCNGGNTGRAYFSAQNTVGNFSHTWSLVTALDAYQALSFSDTLENIFAGNYILEVEDSLACKQSELFSVSQPDPINVTVIPTFSTCSNINGATAEVNSNAIDPVNYVWTINQDGNTTQFGSVATDLYPGIIYLNGTDANGCALPLTEVEILPSPNPLIQVQINELATNTCYNDSDAQLEAVVFNDDNSSINSNVIYQWYFNGEAIPSSEGGTIALLSDLEWGQYIIEVTNENLGCTNSDTIELFNPQEINISLETQNLDCFGDSLGVAIANVSNGILPYTYEWNNTMGVEVASDISNPDNLLAGFYILEVEDANGCKQSQQFEILENDSIGLNLNSQMVSCYLGNDVLFILLCLVALENLLTNGQTKTEKLFQ